MKKLPASRYAVAYCQDVNDGGDAVLCLTPDPSALPGWGHNKPTGLWLDGNATLDLRGPNGQIGDVQVNSTSTDKTWTAFRLQSASAQVWVREFNVVGDTDPDAGNLNKWTSLYGGGLAFTVKSPAPSRLDPLRNVPAPDASKLAPGSDTAGTVYYDPVAKTFTTITGGTLTLKPGYYPGGINIGDSAQITLTGGPDAIYVFGGGSGKKGQIAGLVANAGSSIVGNGVLVYVSGDPDASKWGTPCQYGQISIGGQAVLRLTSRYDAGFLSRKDGADGTALWQDRADTNYASLEGGAGSFMKGTLYCGYNALEVGGNTAQVATQVIAGALWLHGTPQFLIPYDGRNSSKTYSAVLVQ
jgi:hypothetical protein